MKSVKVNRCLKASRCCGATKPICAESFTHVAKQTNVSVPDELQLSIAHVRRTHFGLDMRRLVLHALHGIARGLLAQPMRSRGSVQQTCTTEQRPYEVRFRTEGRSERGDR